MAILLEYIVGFQCIVQLGVAKQGPDWAGPANLYPLSSVLSLVNAHSPFLFFPNHMYFRIKDWLAQRFVPRILEHCGW